MLIFGRVDTFTDKFSGRCRRICDYLLGQAHVLELLIICQRVIQLFEVLLHDSRTHVAFAHTIWHYLDRVLLDLGRLLEIFRSDLTMEVHVTGHVLLICVCVNIPAL